MRIEILAMAAMCAAALMYIGGAESAEAHNFAYFNGVIDVVSYDIAEYADFDLVRMTVQIENLQSGGSVYELVLAIDDGSVVSHVPYGDVRGRGAEVSVDDCASHGRAPHIPASGVANVTACFMVNSGFGADPSSLRVDFGTHTDCGNTCSWHQPTWTPHAAFGQVVPFHKESVYCFVDHSGYCNANNIQHIDGTAAPEPELEPEPELPEPEPAILLHTIYHNQTGVLTLVFDQLVVAGLSTVSYRRLI